MKLISKSHFCSSIVLILLLVLLLLLVVVVVVCNSHAQPETGKYREHLSTKTPYRFLEFFENIAIEDKTCIANKLWSVIRHGTRTPGRKTESSIRTRLQEIRDIIVKYANKNSDFVSINDLETWKPHPELDHKKRLTFIGEEEMLGLGKRFGMRFSEVLPKQWNNSTFTLRFTNTQRTEASAKRFAEGLFGKKEAQHVLFPQPLKRDPILRFYKLCSKWRKNVKENHDALKEVNAFLSSEIFTRVNKNVVKRLALPHGTLNISDIQLIYTTCCFETSWDKLKKSPWCHILSEEEFKILEYSEDLEYYWIDGYGYHLTTQIGCVMLKDVINHLRNENSQQAVFYFTHSGTILKFLSHLGLYRDYNPLRHDNYADHEERLWRTSKIDAFGSNIAFILFKCRKGKFILTLHQERPVILPGCPTESLLCPLEIVEHFYENSLNYCNFEQICSLHDDSVFSYVTHQLYTLYQSVRLAYFPDIAV